MEGFRGVEAIIEGVKVVQGNWGALLFPKGGAFFIGSRPGQPDPSVIACPRSVIYVVPSLDARHPGLDSSPRDLPLVGGNEAGKENEGGGHSV